MFSIYKFISSLIIHHLFMINNSIVVQMNLSQPKNPYKKQLTPNDKLRQSQDERTGIKQHELDVHLLDETQVALVLIHHVYYDVVLYLVAAETPTALESM